MQHHELLSQTIVIAGKKCFGRFQADMEKLGVISQSWCWRDAPPALSLHMLIFGRGDKTMIAITHLLRALERAAVDVELVITDSSFDPGLLSTLPRVHARRPS